VRAADDDFAAAVVPGADDDIAPAVVPPATDEIASRLATVAAGETAPGAAQAAAVAEAAESTRHRELGLTDAEFDGIVERLGREPNGLELAVFSLMWSEHCAYKHSKKLLRTLPTEGRHVVMGPGENAGAVDVGDGLAVAFKVESHNHPSAVEPFQGAATGVGGILRDVFAVGARPIAILDSLRFGELDSPRSRYLFDRAVAGIGHYGNSIGVATVGGEVYFEQAYEQNCLVNAMCLGIAPRERLIRSAAAGVGNHLVLFGALTGRDGIGGASVLASAELGDDDAAKRPTVQIGDPFEEKKLLECSLELLEGGLLASLQDLGAAGLSSSVSEMASKGGVGIDLDVSLVPTREPGMEPFELMISEAQERMLCVVEDERLDGVLAVCRRWEVRATAIGTVTESGHLRIFDGDELVGDMPVTALVDDCPLYELEPKAPATPIYEAPVARLSDDASPAETLLALLRSPNIASKRFAYEQYDSLVGSRTVRHRQPLDAAVLALAADGGSGALAVAIDGNGRRVACDPYTGAVEAVLESARNLACVGAEPLGLTNCLNFGNPEKPHIAWQLTQGVTGLGDACRALDVPVVGGNVSLYNEGPEGPIYPTPIVGMVGMVENPVAIPGGGFAEDGHEIALLGPFEPGLAGSELERLRGRMADGLPLVDLERQAAALRAIREVVAHGGLASAHDVSDGGLACALAECALAGGRGCRVDLAPLIETSGGADPETVLFAEGPGGVVVSGPTAAIDRLDTGGEELSLLRLGRVGGTALEIEAGVARLDVQVDELAAAFESGIPDHFQ